MGARKVCPVLSRVVQTTSVTGAPKNELFEVECLRERCIAFGKNIKEERVGYYLHTTKEVDYCYYIGCELN